MAIKEDELDAEEKIKLSTGITKLLQESAHFMVFSSHSKRFKLFSSVFFSNTLTFLINADGGKILPTGRVEKSFVYIKYLVVGGQFL